MGRKLGLHINEQNLDLLNFPSPFAQLHRSMSRTQVGDCAPAHFEGVKPPSSGHRDGERVGGCLLLSVRSKRVKA